MSSLSGLQQEGSMSRVVEEEPRSGQVGKGEQNTLGSKGGSGQAEPQSSLVSSEVILAL